MASHDIIVGARYPGLTQAKGDNLTNDTSAIQEIIDKAPNYSVITLPFGCTFLVDSLNVSGKILTIIGYGATINCNSSEGAFYKNDHNKKLTIIGVRFTGIGKAIKWIAPVSQTQYDEFSFQDCRFENADYGIYLDGVREGRIINCSFEGILQKGIYRTRSVNHDVIGCFWKNTIYGIHDDGDGSSYSAGLKVLGGTMLGCRYGIYTGMVDYCAVTDVVIDYCDEPLVVLGVDISIVKGCYITTRTLNPAIRVNKGLDQRYAREIRLIGNTVSSNIDNPESDAISLEGVRSGEITSNSITFWWRYGIVYSDCHYLTIERNKINHDGLSTSPTKYSIYESSMGSNTNKIINNEINSGINILGTVISNQTGYPNIRQGEIVIEAGQISKVIPHGAYFAPSKSNVSLTPTNREASTKCPYVAAIDDVNITISLSAPATANAGVSWSITK